MMLHVKFSGSHCNFSHHLLNLMEDCHWSEFLENLPLEFHSLSINSIQLAEIIVVRIPFNLLLPGFHRTVSHFSQAEHRAQSPRRHWHWQWNIHKLDCAISLSIPTLNLGNWSGLCQWCLSDHWSAFLFPWKAVPSFTKDDSLQISNSCHSLFRDELQLEEWYSWTFSK